MKRKVPFVPNEPDNMHCLQASYMMIAKYFDPSFAIPMDEWSEITAFDISTWASAGLLWFKAQGYEVHHISLFDYGKFVERGEEYLVELCGPEVAAWQIEHSNIPAEIERARKLLPADIIEQREPTTDDIRAYLDNGYLIRALINGRKLAGNSGYFGHAVVIYDYDDVGLVLHNPGLPPAPSQHVNWELFESAWADPNVEAKELDAIRKVP